MLPLALCIFVYACEVTVGFYFVGGYFFVHRSKIGWPDCSLIDIFVQT